MSFQEAAENYIREYAEYTARQDALNLRLKIMQGIVADLKKQRDETKCPPWMDVIQELANDLRPHFPEYIIEHSGPFGLLSSAIIHLEKGDESMCVVIIPEDVRYGKYRLVDTTIDSGEFPAGSIGAGNGLNHPSAPLISLDQVINQLKKEYNLA